MTVDEYLAQRDEKPAQTVDEYIASRERSPLLGITAPTPMAADATMTGGTNISREYRLPTMSQDYVRPEEHRQMTLEQAPLSVAGVRYGIRTDEGIKPYGPVPGFVNAITSNKLFGKDVEGTSPVANLLGEGVGYYGAIRALKLLKVPSLLADVGSGLIKGGLRPDATPESVGMEAVLAGALPALADALKGEVPAMAKPIAEAVEKPKIEPVKPLSGEAGEKPPTNAVVQPEAELQVGGITEKPPIEPPKKVEPVTLEEGGTTTLTKADIGTARGERAVPQLDVEKPVKIQETMDYVKETDYTTAAKDVANRINNRAEGEIPTITHNEQAALELHNQDLNRAYDQALQKYTTAVKSNDPIAADLAKNEMDRISTEIDPIERASRTAIAESARTMRFTGETGELSDRPLRQVLTEAQTLKKAPLTPEETAQVTTLKNQVETLRTKLNDLTTKETEWQAERERLVAEKVVAHEKKQAAIEAKAGRAKESIGVDREAAKKKLRELGYRVNEAMGVSAEASYYVGKLAVSYIREGAVTLKQVAEKVMADIPSITERDVWEALNARNPKAIAKQISAIDKRIGKLKTMARLKVQIEDALEGIAPTKTAKPTAPDVQLLQKQLRRILKNTEGDFSKEKNVGRLRTTLTDLQNQFDKSYRNIPGKPKESPEAIALRRKITEVKLRIKIEDAKLGVMPQKAAKPMTPEGIKTLQKQLRDLVKEAEGAYGSGQKLARLQETVNDLKDQLDNAYRHIKNPKQVGPPEVTTLRNRISDLRQRIKIDDELADIEEQKRTGIFKSRLPRSKATSPELQDAQIQLRQSRRELDQMVADLIPPTFWGTVEKGINTLRTAQATADISATFRQGLILSVSDPQAAMVAQSRALKSMFNRGAAEELNNTMMNSGEYKLFSRMGGEVSVFETPLGKHEEMFMNGWFENLKGPLKPVKAVVHGSERHMAVYLNELRMAAFKNFVSAVPNATEQELRAIADFINVASGKGNLKAFGKTAKTLQYLFFAPRFAVSRFQTPYKLYQYWDMPRVRAAIAKDLGKTLAAGTTTLALAKAAGAEVGMDPRSSDFGKIKIGDTRIDIWAGFQQPARLILEVGARGAEKTGAIRPLRGKQDYDPIDALFRFTLYKGSPIVSTLYEQFQGRSVVGEKLPSGVLPRLESAGERLIPMFIADTYDAYKSGGVGRAAWVAPLAVSGIGTSTYKKKRKPFSFED